MTKEFPNQDNPEEVKAYLAAIIESSNDAIISKNLDGTVTSWNPAAERLFGYAAEEMIGRHITTIIPFERREEETLILLKLKRGQRVDHFETVRQAKDGHLIDLSLTISPIHNSEGTIIGASKIARDISQLRQMREHLQLIVESAKDFAIISLDTEGKVTSWNPGAEIIFGYDAVEMIGRNCDVIFTPEDKESRVPQIELETAERFGRAEDERWHVRKDGQRFFASGIMTAMHKTGGKIHGFVKIARDVTSQKRTEENLIEARNAAEAANIAKTEFLANMSHEIRTPMNAVIGLAGILARSIPLTDKQREYIKTLQMSADALLALINDMLDIAKIEARAVELEQIPFSLSQLMQQIISITNVRVQEKGLRLDFCGKSFENRMFIGDPARLQQILMNLPSNAVKFTEKGCITIRVSCAPGAQGKIEEIRIEVEDTGIGIAPEKMETIFHKFVQADTSINRKYGGTGLGLAISKTLAEVMGGSIEVQSTQGKGSLFTLTVPLLPYDNNNLQACAANPSIVAETLPLNEAKAKILLVEDYAPNVMVAQAFLEQFGYECDVAGNGKQAVKKIKSQSYDVILMDVQMHGMNGLEATAAIRAYEQRVGVARTPIIGMTAHALAGDRERCLSAGMDDYISKPFAAKELESMLKQYIANQRMA